MCSERPRYYLPSAEFLKLASQAPGSANLSCVVHALVQACGLFAGVRLCTVPLAARAALEDFHAPDYLAVLAACSRQPPAQDERDEYGLVDDCAPFPGVWHYARYIAGGTVAAARALAAGATKRAIFWDGGRHHAKSDGAAGFCFINDTVLGIMQLQRRFRRILYLDLDAHHGDGVQEAFYCTDRVLTVSLHRYETGFYPGTGALSDRGMHGTSGYRATANLPFTRAAEAVDGAYAEAFSRLLRAALAAHEPDAVVLALGADCLDGDPLGGMHLSSDCVLRCTAQVVRLDAPLLVLGGGGYHKANTARLWAAVTAQIAGVALPESVPEHGGLPLYGPHFGMRVAASPSGGGGGSSSDDHRGSAPESNERVAADDVCARVDQLVAHLEAFRSARSHVSAVAPAPDRRRR